MVGELRVVVQEEEAERRRKQVGARQRLGVIFRVGQLHARVGSTVVVWMGVGRGEGVK